MTDKLAFKKTEPVRCEQFKDPCVIVQENENKLNTEGALLVVCKDLQKNIPVIEKQGTQTFSVLKTRNQKIIVNKKYFMATEVKADKLSKKQKKQILNQKSKFSINHDHTDYEQHHHHNHYQHHHYHNPDHHQQQHQNHFLTF